MSAIVSRVNELLGEANELFNSLSPKKKLVAMDSLRALVRRW